MFSLYIDVSRKVFEGMPVWPGDPEVKVRRHLTVADDGCSVSEVSMGTHTGTHMDFPAHLMEVSSVPQINSMVGPCTVIGLVDLKRTLREGGPLAERVLVKEGCPSFSDAYSLVERGVKLVGVENLSIDEEPSMEVHRLLLGAGVVILEGLRLDDAAEGPAYLISLPLLLDAEDGAPARAVLAY